MEYMYELKEKLCDELEKIARKNDMSAGDLEMAHKLTDTIKNIDKIDMLEDDGYSRDMDYARDGDWEARGTYNRGNSYRGRKRDSMGRYSRRDGKIYSRDDAKSHLMEQIESAMGGANEREREILRKAMDQLEKV